MTSFYISFLLIYLIHQYGIIGCYGVNKQLGICVTYSPWCKVVVRDTVQETKVFNTCRGPHWIKCVIFYSNNAKIASKYIRTDHIDKFLCGLQYMRWLMLKPENWYFLVSGFEISHLRFKSRNYKVRNKRHINSFSSKVILNEKNLLRIILKKNNSYLQNILKS
jgi:hypothetical protein